MSAEEEKGETVPEESEAPKKPAAKKAAAKKPAKAAAKGVEAKTEDADAAETTETKADEGKKPTAKKAAASKKVAGKEPVAATDPAEQADEPAEESAATGPATGERKPARRKPGQPPRRRVVRAHARYVRTSARKARMVCGHLRGKTVPEARAILAFTPREVARDWSKLLESAVANAENNHELLEEDLVVREAYADEGPTIKRFRPRAMGRATPIHKRTSHLTITLTPGA
jgi:ribosomal protein L22